MSETEQNQPVEETPALPEVQQPAPEAEAAPETQTQQVAPEAEAPVPESADGPVVVEAETSESDAQASAEVPLDMLVLEALLFSTRSPLTAQRLAELMEIPSVKPLKKAIKSLNEQYEAAGRCFRVEQVAGGFQMLTLPQFGPAIEKLYRKDADAKLTKSALETLAIVAYKQPILRAQVEAIRGVACGETIRSLMEKHLVRIAGRAEEPGRPILYGTTKRFLEVFGLNTLKDLPQSKQLTSPTATAPGSPAPVAPSPENEPAANAPAPVAEAVQETSEPAPAATPEPTQEASSEPAQNNPETPQPQ